MGAGRGLGARQRLHHHLLAGGGALASGGGQRAAGLGLHACRGGSAGLVHHPGDLHPRSGGVRVSGAAGMPSVCLTCDCPRTRKSTFLRDFV